jgi:hypothetical protein
MRIMFKPFSGHRIRLFPTCPRESTDLKLGRTAGNGSPSVAKDPAYFVETPMGRAA